MPFSWYFTMQLKWKCHAQWTNLQALLQWNWRIFMGLEFKWFWSNYVALFNFLLMHNLSRIGNNYYKNMWIWFFRKPCNLFPAAMMPKRLNQLVDSPVSSDQEWQLYRSADKNMWSILYLKLETSPTLRNVTLQWWYKDVD